MRRFGVEISGNRRRGCQFSPEAKGAMLGQLAAGRSARAVAKEFKTTHTTVLALKKRFEATSTVDYKPRSGRPKVLTKAEERYIIRMIYKDREITWDALTNEVGSGVSSRTIRRIVQRHFRRKWKVMKRPKLTAEHARIRLHWAQAWLADIEELVVVRAFEDQGVVVLLTGLDD
jgi:transposase